MSKIGAEVSRKELRVGVPIVCSIVSLSLEVSRKELRANSVPAEFEPSDYGKYPGRN